MAANSFFYVGQRLSDYTGVDVLVQRVASGGFGQVAMGPNQGNGGRWSALKTLRSDRIVQMGTLGDLAAEKRLQQLFLREALTWKGVWPHPNVLVAQSVTEINGQLMLVLDYAEQGSLRDLFQAAHQNGGWLNIGFALTVAQQIAAGLVALHTPAPDLLRDFPVVHRDLKPENILLSHGYAKITDFGLAKAVTEAIAESVGERHDTTSAALSTTATIATPSGTNGNSMPDGASEVLDSTKPVVLGYTEAYHTRAGAALGTPAYMAPEQWLDASMAKEPADAYAFGIVLAELLTGRHPLLNLEQAHRLEAWRQAHLHGRPLPLRQLGADLFATQRAMLPTAREQVGLDEGLSWLEHLLARLLAKPADARSTMAEAQAELQEAATALGRQPYIPPDDTYPHTVENERIFWTGWADAYFHFELYAKALACSERARAVASYHPHVLTSHANILLGLKQYGETLEVYRQALAATPETDIHMRALILHNLGGALNEMGRYAEAEEAHAKEVALIPDSASGWFSRARNQGFWAEVEIEMGNRETGRALAMQGLASAEQAASLNPNHADYRRLAQMLRQLCDRL